MRGKARVGEERDLQRWEGSLCGFLRGAGG